LNFESRGLYVMFNLIQPFRKSFTLIVLSGMILGLLVPGLLMAGNASGNDDQEHPGFRIAAQRWEEAEKIFRSDPRWLGGDGATSVDLGDGRVLWLFGDSFIDPSGSGIRRTSDLVRNSIAIQTGYDPVGAEMKFSWKIKNAKPAAFFEPKNDHWFWPGSGVMIGKRLLIFLMEIQAAKNELGFEACGWKAVMINDPQKAPERWKLIYLVSPQKDNLIVGSGNPISENGYLQVFAADDKDRAIYLVRWSIREARSGILTMPQWWTGESAGWIGKNIAGVKPCSIMTQGQMEFTVEYAPRLKRYLQIQTLSFMTPCMSMMVAAELTGPWSSHSCFFTPSEQGMADILIYAGKSHPMLLGADMVFTYVVNTPRQDRLLQDMSIYFPVMLKGRVLADEIFP
jgi:hypothetical protein